MHICMFVDQHPTTLGGMQTSVRLQRKYLERLGHTVTICSPRSRDKAAAPDPFIIGLPSLPLGPGEYSMVLPGKRSDAALDRALAGFPPVDLVHVQADFWQAIIGYRYAGRTGLPVVHTMHNRLDVGIRATMPFPTLVTKLLIGWQRRMLPARRDLTAANAWDYLADFTRSARRVTAPSSHFALLLEEQGVFGEVDVVSNGMDDDVAARVLAVPRPRPLTAGDRRPRLVWVGRFSAEKRLMQFLQGLESADLEAVVDIYGDGALRRQAERFTRRLGRTEVRFRGKVSYEQMLTAMREADLLVQTSQGFETQGMTVFEAALLGTPSVLSDHRIAVDLPADCYWLTTDDSVEGLASALQRAVAELRSGARGTSAALAGGDFLQSAQTARMLEIYRLAGGA